MFIRISLSLADDLLMDMFYGVQVTGVLYVPLGTHFTWENLSTDLVGKKSNVFVGG